MTIFGFTKGRQITWGCIRAKKTYEREVESRYESERVESEPDAESGTKEQV